MMVWSVTYHTKECVDHQTTALISHASKVMLQILHARLQDYVNQELPDVQPGCKKGRGTRDQIANIHWIIEKQGNFRKSSISVSSTMIKPLTVWIMTNCEKLLERWGYQTTSPVSWETCMQVKKQQLEPCMEQMIGSRLRKEWQGCLLSPCLLKLYAEHIMRNAGLDELPAGI